MNENEYNLVSINANFFSEMLIKTLKKLSPMVTYFSGFENNYDGSFLINIFLNNFEVNAVTNTFKIILQILCKR